MKTFLLKNPKRILAVAGLASICGLFGTASAQYTGRIYADAQAWGTSGLGSKTVSNAGDALATSSLQDFSTPSITLGALNTTVRQYLQFHNADNSVMTLPTGTVVHIKVGVSAGLLGLDVAGLLGNTTIGSFTGLSGGNGTANATRTPGPSTSGGNTLLTLLSGAGTDEIAYTTTAPSNGIYLELKTPVIGVGYSGDLFHAYIYGDVATSPECPKTIDWTYSTGASGLASAVGNLSTINNPENAVDQDPTTAATLNPVNVLNTTNFNLTLNTPAKVGDSIRILISNPNSGLLNLAALHGMAIKAYDGPNQVGANIDETSGLLTLQLLPQSTGINAITGLVEATGAQTSTTFDRISLQIGGVADVSSLLGNGSINIYGVDVVVPAPTLGAGKSDIYAYAGRTVDLSSLATSNAAGDPIVWIDSTTGAEVTSTTITASSNNHYYGLSQRNGCTDASDTAKVFLHVNKTTSPALTAGNVGTAYSQVITASIDGDQDLPNAPVYSFTYASGSFSPTGTVRMNLLTTPANSSFAFYAMAPVYAAGPLSAVASQAFATTDLTHGLSFDDATGTVSGTPDAEGTYSLTLNVHDNANNLDAGQITKTIEIAAALPVTMSDFQVKLDNNKNAVLTWITESEQGSIRFDVLHSNDGVNFSTIGSVDAAGVSTKTKHYTFTDNNPGAKSYYKLNIVKNDGIKSSDVVSISGGRVAGFSINPNPATNDITITGINASDIKSVNIYDAGGRLVQKATNNHINVRNLSQGIYFVTIVTKDGNKTNGKFLKK